MSIREKDEPAAAAAEQSTGWADEIKVYIGPSIIGVSQGTVFSNGLTEVLKRAMDETPAIRNLVVSLSELARAQTELADSRTARAKMFEVVSEKYNQGGLKHGFV